MNNETLEAIIKRLGLVPLGREGGLHANTYVSDQRTADGEVAGTCIFYLLRGDAFSHLHRLTGDEIYHFYLGDPVEMLELLEDGTSRTTILGPDILRNQEVQHLVRAGTWQGSHLAEGGSWALLGTTMCPGYSDSSYTHGDAAELIAQYPDRAREIALLTGTVVH